MKTKLFLTGLLSLCILTGFTSCSDDDDDIKPTEILTKALEEKYPEATKVKWQDKKGFKVADFTHDGFEKEAWYDDAGVWFMTKTELESLLNTPEAVQKAHKAGKYADWKIDDVEKLERANPKATYYIIEVEKGEEEFDLYYLEDGTLHKEVADHDGANEYFPVVPESITEFINKEYPGARIKDIDSEYNYELKKRVIEIDIIHDQKEKEVQLSFDNYKWIKTDWEISWAVTPEVIQKAFKAKYPNNKADDVDYSVRPEGVFYVIELDDVTPDIYAIFQEDGTFVIELNNYN